MLTMSKLTKSWKFSLIAYNVEAFNFPLLDFPIDAVENEGSECKLHTGNCVKQARPVGHWFVQQQQQA